MPPYLVGGLHCICSYVIIAKIMSIEDSAPALQAMRPTFGQFDVLAWKFNGPSALIGKRHTEQGYTRVTAEMAGALPVEAGFYVGATPAPIRPYGYNKHSAAFFLALDDHDRMLSHRFDALPGVEYHGTVQAWNGKGEQRELPVVAFSYCKYKDGVLETKRRVVALDPDAPFGYGVHPDHDGQPADWYLRGKELDAAVLDKQKDFVLAEISDGKNFFMGSIEGAPLGYTIAANQNPEHIACSAGSLVFRGDTNLGLTDWFLF